MSDNDVPIEKIADLVGHRTTIVTQTVYRHQLRPVIETGATAMNTILTARARPLRVAPGSPSGSHFGSHGETYIRKIVGRTGFEPVTSSVSGLLGALAHVRQAWLRCLRCCPGVTATTLGRPPHRACGGHAHCLRCRGDWRLAMCEAAAFFRQLDGAALVLVEAAGVIPVDSQSGDAVQRLYRVPGASARRFAVEVDNGYPRISSAWPSSAIVSKQRNRLASMILF